LVEFSDFECPFCRRLHRTLAELRTLYPSEVAVIYRHYPLRNHPRAMPAAIASECAAEQGRFEAYANLVFELQDSLGRVAWEQIAVRSGVVDTARFRACRSRGDIRAVVDSDYAAGWRLHLEGTPAMIIGNQLILGATPLDTLRILLGLSGRTAHANPDDLF
jgi:protein-disulfide isomerase